LIKVQAFKSFSVLHRLLEAFWSFSKLWGLGSFKNFVRASQTLNRILSITKALKRLIFHDSLKNESCFKARESSHLKLLNKFLEKNLQSF
jgi:hypothetical protein